MGERIEWAEIEGWRDEIQRRGGVCAYCRGESFHAPDCVQIRIARLLVALEAGEGMAAALEIVRSAGEVARENMVELAGDELKAKMAEAVDQSLRIILDEAGVDATHNAWRRCVAPRGEGA